MDAQRNWIEPFHHARSDRGQAVLEGIHPLKHALRFGARVTAVVTSDRERLLALAHRLAPELVSRLSEIEELPAELFSQLVPRPPATGVLALARRPALVLEEVRDSPSPAPIVLLERPAHPGNQGAAVRVAAAAGAVALFSTGPHDPWAPEALRGGAGLQFALPVAGLDEVAAEALLAGARPLIAIDPEGAPLAPGSIPPRAVLAFGSERRGLSAALRRRADAAVAIPMRPGVSSLNLATAVAVVLYAGVAEAGVAEAGVAAIRRPRSQARRRRRRKNGASGSPGE